MPTKRSHLKCALQTRYEDKTNITYDCLNDQVPPLVTVTIRRRVMLF